jgi:hypothetical protein
MITKILFCLHPTHVEVTANAANRNHILAVLCSTILCFPSSSGTTTPWWLFLPTLIAGYLASETFLFQIPAAMVTMVVIAYVQKQQQQQPKKRQSTPKSSSSSSLIYDYILIVVENVPRLFILFISLLVYYGGRAYYETLDIPEGLIRPAENPFYHFEGIHRVRNYLYVIAVHLHKSIWMIVPPPIRFSHEYGYDCISQIHGWDDPRMVSVYCFGCVLVASLVVAIACLFKNHTTNNQKRLAGQLFGWIAIQWSWMLTLFPITGLVKVGTFVSDRIVVASTVSMSWILGVVFYNYLTRWFHKLPFKPLQVMLLSWYIVTSTSTIYTRTLDWMDSISLLNSSLVTCPRFAKAHMEVSKIHSGLYPSLFNLTKSRYHLEVARDIDPDMCDLHQQFAHVAIQEGKYREYEEELTQAVLCPFSMSGALPMWQRYWQIAIESVPIGTPQRIEIEQRQGHYTRIIQEAVQEAQIKEVEAQKLKEEKAKTRGMAANKSWWHLW